MHDKQLNLASAWVSGWLRQGRLMEGIPSKAQVVQQELLARSSA